MSTADSAELVIRPTPVRRNAPLDVAPRIPDRTFHGVLFVLSLAVLVAAWLLEVRGEQQVAVRWINFTLPGVCSFQRLFGIPCPGCGLTRCFVSVTHGDFARAWSFNPAGMLLFTLVLSQIPYRAWQLVRWQRQQPEIVLGDWTSWILWGVLAMLVGQWFARGLGML